MRAASSSQTEIASTLSFFLSLLFSLLNFPKSNKSWQLLKEEQKKVDRVGFVIYSVRSDECETMAT